MRYLPSLLTLCVMLCGVGTSCGEDGVEFRVSDLLEISPEQIAREKQASALRLRYAECHQYAAPDVAMETKVKSTLAVFAKRMAEVSKEQDMWDQGFRFVIEDLDPNMEVSYWWPLGGPIRANASEIARSNGFEMTCDPDAVVLCSMRRILERYVIRELVNLRAKVVYNGDWRSPAPDFRAFVKELAELHLSHESLKWDDSGRYSLTQQKFEGVLSKSNAEEVLVIEKMAGDDAAQIIYLLPVKQMLLIAKGEFERVPTFLHYTEYRYPGAPTNPFARPPEK